MERKGEDDKNAYFTTATWCGDPKRTLSPVKLTETILNSINVFIFEVIESKFINNFKIKITPLIYRYLLFS